MNLTSRCQQFTTLRYCTLEEPVQLSSEDFHTAERIIVIAGTGNSDVG